MTPQVDAAIATNAALNRNHLEIAGMRSPFSLTKLPASVTACPNDVPAKGFDESAARIVRTAFAATHNLEEERVQCKRTD